MLILVAIAAFAGAATLVLLIYAVTQISSLRAVVNDLVQKSAKVRTVSAGLEQRLGKLEEKSDDIATTLGRIEVKLQNVGREVYRVNAAPNATTLPSASMPPEARRVEGSGSGVASESGVASVIEAGGGGADAVDDRLPPAYTADVPADPTAAGMDAVDALLEEYRRLIAQPRRIEISRWLDEHGGLSCEPGDDDVFQLVARGDGGRLVLLPFADQFALLVPSALFVVDFATSFSDVLSARAALRNTYALDADGTGVLRLVNPALAIADNGAWKLRRAGRLGGLAGS